MNPQGASSSFSSSGISARFWNVASGHPVYITSYHNSDLFDMPHRLSRSHSGPGFDDLVASPSLQDPQMTGVKLQSSSEAGSNTPTQVE